MAISTGDLIARRSVDVLKQGQAASGAFIASPAFPTYHYAWLRDGSFCAHALDRAGEHDRAAAFHDWVVRSVEAHRAMVESAIARVEAGETPPPESMPPARYTVDGARERDDDDPWPNFQIDGYGIWLWALDRHLRRDLTADKKNAVELIARYLAATWPLKCFDCWEELDGGEHASTLGAVIAGLDAAARILTDDAWAFEAARVREHLLDRFLVDGRFRRGPADDRLDGSLLWLGVPFEVLPPADPRVAATVEAVERDLSGPRGGVYRYRGDTYYGGGEWILLTCSLGWHGAAVGDRDTYARARAWVRTSAHGNGDLPEQVTGCAQDASMIEPWIERWGPVATPLLWSHAMYLLMEDAAGG